LYEFNKKEVRSAFKKTEYGKKVNKWLYLSIGLFVLTILVPFFLGFLDGLNVYRMTEEALETFSRISDVTIFAAAALVFYFDGKRDGAIESYKKVMKK